MTKRLMLMAALAGTGCQHLETPPPKRPMTGTRVMRAPKDVEVRISPWSYAGWIVTVANKRTSNVRIVWDDSTFVDGRGESYGRLIRGNTRIIDMYRVQPTTPVPPSSRVIEYCAPEDLAGWLPGQVLVDDNEVSAPEPNRSDVCAALRKDCTAAASDCAAQHQRCMRLGPVKMDASAKRGTAPIAVSKGVGRLVITIEDGTTREQWEAAISFDESALPLLPVTQTKTTEPTNSTTEGN